MSNSSSPQDIPGIEEIARYMIHADALNYHAAKGALLDVMLPNGKRLRDCTLGEVRATEARMQQISELMGDRTLGEYARDAWAGRAA